MDACRWIQGRSQKKRSPGQYEHVALILYQIICALLTNLHGGDFVFKFKQRSNITTYQISKTSLVLKYIQNNIHEKIRYIVLLLRLLTLCRGNLRPNLDCLIHVITGYPINTQTFKKLKDQHKRKLSGQFKNKQLWILYPLQINQMHRPALVALTDHAEEIVDFCKWDWRRGTAGGGGSTRAELLNFYLSTTSGLAKKKTKKHESKRKVRGILSFGD